MHEIYEAKYVNKHNDDITEDNDAVTKILLLKIITKKALKMRNESQGCH